MNLKLVLAISVLTVMPTFGQTDRLPAKPTRADVQRVVQTISADKEKLQTYCDLDKLHQQIADASKDTKTFEKTFADLSPKVDALVQKLGPDYAMLMDGLDRADENSGGGKDIAASFDEITAAFQSLDKLCK
jgi:hypothetical protein